MDDDELYLVIGSTRKAEYRYPFANQIMGDKTDLTHLKTFNGKATTLDIKPCALPGAAHIQADARTYNPKGKVIAASFWELFPCMPPPPLPCDVFIETELHPEKPGNYNNIMFMPETIRNIAQNMKKGAPLYMEYMPLVCNANFPAYWGYHQNSKTHNPFPGLLSPFFMENIEMRNHAERYAKLAHLGSAFMNKTSLHEWNVKFAPFAFEETIKSHHLVCQAIKNIEQLLPASVQVQNRLNDEYKLYKKSPSQFIIHFMGSLSELVGMEFAMLAQKELIKSFLEKNGFSDVTIERQDNPFNGRRNVWWITGTRNDQPIIQNNQ